MKLTGSFLSLRVAIIVLATSTDGGVMRRLRHKNPTTNRTLEEPITEAKLITTKLLTAMQPTRQPTTRAEPTVKPNSLKPTKQSLSASTPPPNRATCLLDATIGTNGCPNSAPYCVSGLIGPTCSVCDVKDGTSVGCTNERETCGMPSCVRDLPLSCKLDHEASCPSKRPTSLTPTSRKPTSRKPTFKQMTVSPTSKPTTPPTTRTPTASPTRNRRQPTSRKPTSRKPTSRKPKSRKPKSRKPTSLKQIKQSAPPSKKPTSLKPTA